MMGTAETKPSPSKSCVWVLRRVQLQYVPVKSAPGLGMALLSPLQATQDILGSRFPVLAGSGVSPPPCFRELKSQEANFPPQKAQQSWFRFAGIWGNGGDNLFISLLGPNYLHAPQSFVLFCFF